MLETCYTVYIDYKEGTGNPLQEELIYSTLEEAELEADLIRETEEAERVEVVKEVRDFPERRTE